VNKNLLSKILALGIVILFIGIAVTPSINGTTVKKMYITENHFQNKYSNYSQEIVISGGVTTALIVGVIHDLKTEGDLIKFRAGGKYLGPLLPLRIYPIPSLEFYDNIFWWDTVTISKQKIGIITPFFIFAICKIIPPSTNVTMNVKSHDDITNTIVWEVTKVEGEPIGYLNLFIRLWSDNYSSWSWVQYHDHGWGYLSPGDEIPVQASPGGYYTTSFIDKVSLATLSESQIINY
jgi:hypothetical protein